MIDALIVGSRGASGEATVLLEHAIRSSPGTLQDWRALGISREQAGDWKGAAEAYAKYLEVAPEAKDAPEVKKRLDKARR